MEFRSICTAILIGWALIQGGVWVASFFEPPPIVAEAPRPARIIIVDSNGHDQVVWERP